MNILIIRISAIGDIFLATQFAKYVKESVPNSQVHWIAETGSMAILKNNPYIDKIIPWKIDKKHGIKALFKSAETIDLSTEYDLVIDLQCLLKIAPIMFKVKAKKKIGISEFEFPMNIFYNKIIKTKRFEPLKEKYYRIAQEVLDYKGPISDPITALSKEEKEFADNYFTDNNLDKVIGCIFATSMDHKYWDKDKWIELSQIIKEKYNAKCLLFGAPGDKEYADYLLSKSDNFISLVGKTSICEAMAILNKCIATVSTDTAMMHFASILNIPTISLYGTNFFYSHHLGRENVEIIFKGNWKNKDKKVPNKLCKENMLSITCEDVIKGLEKYI